SDYTRELIDAIPGRNMQVLASPAISLQG
ncbi:MAG: hypothetical protein QOG78_3332, partial [Rhodospirillaceae bacterium]|nr:hypothetical protein [Rhodospirillaceae bacterium]